jgi:periplasmic copper chaperone A
VRVIRRTAVLLAVVLVLPACGSAEVGETEDLGAVEEVGALEEAAAELVVTDVRSRMSPRRAGVAAVYLDIDNPTDHDDALVAASVPPEVAAVVELHETYVMETVEDGMDTASGHGGSDGDDPAGDHDGMGMMGMREVASVPIPAGETVALAPGGYHIMLIDLVTDLVPGDTFEVTLEFERAGQRTVAAEVREQA